jgi:replicative DNA helicase
MEAPRPRFDPARLADALIDRNGAGPSKAYGMMTGLEEIDVLTTGFYIGDFIVIGARTSIGKSALIKTH